MILALLGPGEIVGEMSLLDRDVRSANAVTLEESTILWMGRRTLQECLQSMPAFADNLMRILCGRLRRADERIQSLATLNVSGRVARQILALAQQHGRINPNGDMLIPIRLTQNDIACLIGASRERVNQVITAYKRSRYISVDQDYRITVHNQEALARECQLPRL